MRANHPGYCVSSLFPLDIRSWRRASKKKRKTDAIQIYSWHASTILYDRQQDKVIESCQVFLLIASNTMRGIFPPPLICWSPSSCTCPPTPSHAVHPFLPHYRLGEHLASDQPLFFCRVGVRSWSSGFGDRGAGWRGEGSRQAQGSLSVMLVVLASWRGQCACLYGVRSTPYVE